MDFVHRKPQQKDFRMGRECQFCSHHDPEFGNRKPIDRLVTAKLDDTAAAHITEDGYVKHRLLELRTRFGVRVSPLQSPAA
jgi:hypothetical protein